MAALFDFLKHKKEIEKSKKPAKKAREVKLEKKTEKKEEIKTAPPAKEISKKGFSFEAVRQPHISEKATYLSEKDQYVFEVLPNYNKNEIRKAVEAIYGVNVLSVNLVKIPAKRRRVGRTEGYRKGFKKAIVKIKKGQKIEIL